MAERTFTTMNLGAGMDMPATTGTMVSHRRNRPRNTLAAVLRECLPALKKRGILFQRPQVQKPLVIMTTEPVAHAVAQRGASDGRQRGPPWIKDPQADQHAANHHHRTARNDGADHGHRLQQDAANTAASASAGC
jgi:hypothetical protein